MSSIRACVVLFVLLVQFQSIISKPFFMDLICDLICDDDDDTSTTTTSASTEDDYFDFCDCTPTTRRPNNMRGQPFAPSQFNIRLPPSNGMNLSMINTNGIWSFGLDALQNGQVTPPFANGPTTLSPTTAGGTTAAGTTAAPTTAKK
ncbi:uncharacterized protein LOC126772875 [Nymphalis io]|uniref:uncharacterized protein LOC126772875 n=1 Tax=Inachis io TaxID=171585 RepID=UPI00216A6DB6|nr:uncharacterized protein LOC126772875 [Nymphalis io]